MVVAKKKKENTCGYCECNRRSLENHFLCAEHYEDWVAGFLDRCPKCGRFKDVMYRLCFDCYFGRPVTPWKPLEVFPTPEKTQNRVEYSEAWVDGYMRRDRFFVYILEFDDGSLFVGHTTDLSKGLSEHREQKMLSGTRRSPKLQYVQIVATEKAAQLRQAELERLIKSNPNQIHLMVADFKSTCVS